MFSFFKRKRSRAASEDVARVFAETLGIESVDPDANFFELGGDSMLATIVVASLDEAGHPLPATAVFDFPTINSLVDFIESDNAPPSAGTARTIQVHPRNPTGTTRMAPSLLQERLWPFERNPDPKRFQLRGEGAVLLTGPLEVSLLKDSITHAVQRHEVLRSTFVEDTSVLHVDVHPALPIAIDLFDAAGDTTDTRRADAARLVAQVTSEVFDLEQAPPFRCTVIKISETEHVLAISMHHIISDGWSMGVLIGEIAKTYEALVKGNRPALPDLPYQFADYAAWHREWLASEAGQTSKEFWRQYLSNLPPALHVPLPNDLPRQTEFNFPVRRQTVPLNQNTQDAIRALAKSTQTSVHTVFLAGVLAAIHRLTDTTDLPIGIMNANRNTPGTQNLIGFFSTLVILRFQLSTDDTSLATLIDKVRTATREVESHSGVPIGVLMDEGIVDTLPRIFIDSVPRPAMPSIEGLTLEEFPFEHPPLFAVADIAVFLFDNGTNLTCLLGTNENMFSETAAGQLISALQQSISKIEP